MKYVFYVKKLKIVTLIIFFFLNLKNRIELHNYTIIIFEYTEKEL